MSRTERFEAREAAELRPLPETPYDYGTWRASIKVQRHYHVNVDGRDYSVPYRLIGEDVSIKTTAATVEIYHDSSLVAVHARRIVTPQDDAPVIDPAHMPENHRAMWRQNPDALIERATSYSTTLARFVSLHLEVNGNPRATHNMLGRLLEVGSVHGKAAIDAACVEAIRRNQINADTLRQILDRGPRSVLITTGIRLSTIPSLPMPYSTVCRGIATISSCAANLSAAARPASTTSDRILLSFDAESSRDQAPKDHATGCGILPQSGAEKRKSVHPLGAAFSSPCSWCSPAPSPWQARTPATARR